MVSAGASRANLSPADCNDADIISHPRGVMAAVANHRDIEIAAFGVPLNTCERKCVMPLLFNLSISSGI